MNIASLEIKARCGDPDRIRKILQERGAKFQGTDHQVDTYFNVAGGRLKMRQGNIENYLIHYHREDTLLPKESHIMLHKFEPASCLREMLVEALGIKIIVDKIREIYYIGNVKFHIDQVKGLGSFVEIEARYLEQKIAPEKLEGQCYEYLEILGIKPGSLLPVSYSDLLLEELADPKNNNN